MNTSDTKWLVVITGPVGAGKTTTADTLAAHLRAHGRPAASIDMDLIYAMARQQDGYADETTWRTTRVGSAALADSFFKDGIEVVIVEGGFHSEDEYDELSRNVTANVEELFVGLDVSFDETKRRVDADPTPDRVFSRDPNILRALHELFVAALPYVESAGVVIDANELGPDELAKTIAARVEP